MVKTSESTVAASASKVSISTAFSRILGLVREQVVAYYFGASLVTDAFVAAFRVPNLLRDLFAEGALSSAFVPVFKEKCETEGDAQAYELANLVMSALLLIVGIIVAVGILASPAIIYISAKGFTVDAYKFALTVNLTRIMFVYLLMVSISAVVMGMLNSKGVFGIPALSSSMFNLGMIISPMVLYNYFSAPIYTLAIGVLIGGIGQLVFQLPTLYKLGYRFRFKLDFNHPGIRKIGRLISPMILGLSASRINILINTLLASLMIEGAMSYLNFAYRLMHFPLGVFGVALGTVTLPKVSGQAARNDFDQLVDTFHEAIGLAFFLVIPSAVYLAFFGEDLVGLIYERGAFDSTATVQTARALSFYAVGLVGFACVRVTAPIYYALGDSKKPMYYSIVAVVINVVLNFAFIPIWGFAGLAGATSIAGLANFLLLLFNLKGKIENINYVGLLRKSILISLGSLAAYLVIAFLFYYININTVNISGKIISVALQTLGFGLIYLGLMKLIGSDEIKRLLKLFKK